MREEKLKQATELIKELVPDIMTVQSGCVLVSKFGYQSECVHSCDDDIVHLFGHVEYDLIIDSIYRDYHVLGRRIELRDVLLAVCRKNINEWNVYCMYDKTEPFTEQQEEFYELIIKTLK